MVNFNAPKHTPSLNQSVHNLRESQASLTPREKQQQKLAEESMGNWIKHESIMGSPLEGLGGFMPGKPFTLDSSKGSWPSNAFPNEEGIQLLPHFVPNGKTDSSPRNEHIQLLPYRPSAEEKAKGPFHPDFMKNLPYTPTAEEKAKGPFHPDFMELF
jgi:hypothetical protein